MPRYHTPSPSPSPDRRRSGSRPGTSQQTRSRSRFSEASTSSRGDGRRALSRPPSARGSLRPRRHSDDSSSYRSSRSRSRSSSRRPHGSVASKSLKDRYVEKKDKIPFGFLAGIGVSALLLHKYWPKGWLHGDEKYWDRLGRDKRDKVDDAIRDRRDRAEAAIRHKGEAVRERAGPAYEGFREGYVRERDGGGADPRDRGRERAREWDPGYGEGYREARSADPRRRRSMGDEDARRRRVEPPRHVPAANLPPPDFVNDHVYDAPPGRRRYADAGGDWYQGPPPRRPQPEYRY